MDPCGPSVPLKRDQARYARSNLVAHGSDAKGFTALQAEHIGERYPWRLASLRASLSRPTGRLRVLAPKGASQAPSCRAIFRALCRRADGSRVAAERTSGFAGGRPIFRQGTKRFRPSDLSALLAGRRKAAANIGGLAALAALPGGWLAQPLKRP